LNLYGAGFSQEYPNQIYQSNLLAMAKTLGYPDPDASQINAVVRFLRQALKMDCGDE
jgi:hypothetical protein